MLQDPVVQSRLLQWVLSALALLITSRLVSGFRLGGFFSALVAAFVIGVANVVLRPLLIILTLPINLLTLGLFTFVVNAIILKICSALMPRFAIDGFLPALWGAIVLALVNTGLAYLFYA